MEGIFKSGKGEMPNKWRCETSNREEPSHLPYRKTQEKMHMKFVFDEQELSMKKTTSSKTHKEKIQTRTNKYDAMDAKV